MCAASAAEAVRVLEPDLAAYSLEEAAMSDYDPADSTYRVVEEPTLVDEADVTDIVGRSVGFAELATGPLLVDSGANG